MKLQRDGSPNSDIRLEIEYRDPATLKLNPKNTRHHSAAQIAKLAANMAAFGMIVPVLRDREDGVVCGHARVMAARQIGLKKLPTILLDHLSPAQLRLRPRREPPTRSRRMGRTGTRRGAQVAFLPRARLFARPDRVRGRRDRHVALGLPGAADAANENIGAFEGPPVSRPGDLWQLEKHRLLCGSSLEKASFARLLDGKVADVIFSDPPYGVRIAGHASTRRGAKKHREFLMGGEIPRRSCGGSFSSPSPASNR